MLSHFIRAKLRRRHVSYSRNRRSIQKDLGPVIECLSVLDGWRWCWWDDGFLFRRYEGLAILKWCPGLTHSAISRQCYGGSDRDNVTDDRVEQLSCAGTQRRHCGIGITTPSPSSHAGSKRWIIVIGYRREAKWMDYGAAAMLFIYHDWIPLCHSLHISCKVSLWITLF